MKILYCCKYKDDENCQKEILAIYDNEELAKKFINKHPYCEIQEFTLNKYENELKSDMNAYFIKLSITEEVLEIYKCMYQSFECFFNRFDNSFYIGCFAKNKEDAIKIAKQKFKMPHQIV